MDAQARRKFEMGQQVLDFTTKHPFAADPGYTAVVEQLQAQMSHANALVVQEVSGRQAAHAAIEQRNRLRRTIKQQLRHLVQVAERAVTTHPDLVGLVQAPDRHAPNDTFIVAAHAAIAVALPVHDLLSGLGAGQTFFVKLDEAVARFDAMTVALHNARSAHIGARAELSSTGSRCAVLVAVLDGLNRMRLEGDIELLAEWESARSAVGPFRIRTTAGTEEGAVAVA